MLFILICVLTSSRPTPPHPRKWLWMLYSLNSVMFEEVCPLLFSQTVSWLGTKFLGHTSFLQNILNITPLSLAFTVVMKKSDFFFSPPMYRIYFLDWSLKGLFLYLLILMMYLGYAQCSVFCTQLFWKIEDPFKLKI